MKRWVQAAVSVVVLGGFVWVISNQWPVIVDAFRHVSAVRLLFVLLLMLPIYPLTVYAWQILLSSLDKHIPFRQAFAVWMLGNAARFLPAGSVWQWVTRVYAAEAHGIPKAKTFLSSAYEVAFLVVSSFLVIAVTLPFWPSPVPIPGWLGAVALAALVALWPSTLPNLVRMYARLRGRPIASVPRLSWKVIAAVLGLGFLRAVANGAALWLLVSFFTPLAIHDLWWMIGAYRLAWLIGYVTVFAPAGIGVADTVLAGLLAVPIGFGTALGIALLYRAINIVNELALLIVAAAFHPGILTVFKKSPASINRRRAPTP